MKKTLLFVFVSLFALGVAFSGCSKDDAAGGFTMYGTSTAPAALMAAGISSFAGATVYPGTPTELKMEVYGVWASTNTDCSNPIALQDYGATAEIKDMAANPVLFTASPPAGTYQCVILKIKDTFSFKPDATAQSNLSVCEAGTTHWMDIYRHGESDDGTWTDLNGGAVDGTGEMLSPGVDTVYIFASTNESAVTNRFPVLHLNSALVVPGSATFYISFANKFSNPGIDECWVEEPSMGFK